MLRLNRSSLILLVALALGLAWDVLFYGKPVGISLPLFVLSLLAALFGMARWEGTPPAWRNLWLVMPLLFLAVMGFVRANPFLTFLNVAASLSLLGLIAHFYAAGRVERTRLIEYPLLLLLAVGNALVRPAPLISARVDWQSTREQSGRSVLPVARGCLLALPVLLVFTCLLASADLVFAKYVDDVLRLQFLSDALEWLWRGLLVLAVAWVALGGLAYALARRQATEDKPGLVKGVEVLGRLVSLGFTETAIVLAGVDVLFLAFVWVQFVYLFGGQANIGVEGYTYADYARRGFFELVAVSLLTLGLILSLHHVGCRKIGWQKYVFNGLSSLMVALVLVILASAFKRMVLYEAAYGYTQLRVYSHIFEAWLAFTFVWFLITLWLRPDRFAVGAFAAALGFIVTLNLVNPDALIVRQNLARYQATGDLAVHTMGRTELDVLYLTRLSDDAVPALAQSASQLSGEHRRTLEDHLRARLSRMEKDTRWRRWPAFHLARQQAYHVLLASQSSQP